MANDEGGQCVGSVERSIRNGSVRLAALEWAGDSPPLVIVPGITSPAATWAFVVEALALSRRVLTLDVRGRGHSDAPHAAYTLDKCASDLHAWCTRLDLERPVLLGHSMGARIVARLAATHPALAGRVILVDPPLSGPGRAPYPLPLSFYLDGIRRARAGMTLEEMRLSSPGWSDERLADRLRWLPTCSEQAVAAAYRQFHEEDFVDDWRRLKGDVYLLRGADSPVVKEEGMQELQRLQPGFHCETIASAGHMIPWDNLPGFIQAVRSITALT